MKLFRCTVFWGSPYIFSKWSAPVSWKSSATLSIGANYTTTTNTPMNPTGWCI